MRILLGMIILFAAAPSVFSASYSCRDSQGRLFLSDNLQALPEECRAAAIESAKENPDNLHFVPEQKSDVRGREKFERQVREVEQELQRKKEIGERLLGRARELSREYQDSINEKIRVRRRWVANSKATIRKMNERIEQIRAAGKQVLTEVENERIDRDTKRQIINELSKIKYE